MKPLPHQASTYEQQLAMAILAHAARNDQYALALLLEQLVDPSADLHPICIIAALVNEFQRGMDTHGNRLANWFASQAVTLAGDGTSGGR